MNGFHLYRSQKGEQKFFYRSINVTEIQFRANFIVDLSKKSNNHDQDKQAEQKEQIAEKNNTQQPANRENISHIRTIEEIYLENIYDDFNSYPNINHADIDNHPLVQKVKGLNFKDTVRELKLTRQLSSLNETERGAIVKIISDFSILEPLIEPDAKCQAEIQSSTKCEDYSQNLGPERSKPIKIGHLLLFGFESDVLEIHLHEIYDFVDKIFITEAERTHFMNTPKPLLWPQLAKQKRFSKFLNKIVYLVITDELIELTAKPSEAKNIWRNEDIQEELRWKMFLSWNKKHNNYFADDDIIGFGDSDEITSSHNLALIKKCELKGVTDIGAWFTFGQISKVFYSHFPVKGHPNTLGDPTYWTFQAAKNSLKIPSRNRGKSPYYLLGGLHLTRYRYLPHIVAKELSATEAGSTNHPVFHLLNELVNSNISPHELKLEMMKFIDKWSQSLRYQNIPNKNLGTPPYIIPWWLKCNQKRYASFFDDYETLDQHYE